MRLHAFILHCFFFSHRVLDIISGVLSLWVVANSMRTEKGFTTGGGVDIGDPILDLSLT